MRTGVWEGGRAGGKAGGQQAGRPQAPQANWLLAWSSKDPHKTFTAYTASGPCGKAAHRDAAEGGLDVGGVGRRLGSSRDGGGGSTHHLRAWCKYETSAPRSMLQKAAACLLSEAPPPPSLHSQQQSKVGVLLPARLGRLLAALTWCCCPAAAGAAVSSMLPPFSLPVSFFRVSMLPRESSQESQRARERAVQAWPLSHEG